MTYNLPSLWRLGSIRTLTAVTVIWGATLSIFAQTRPSVELSFAGNQPVLVISGDTGAVYSVQWSSDISSPSAWRSRTLFRAHNTKTVWTDPLTASTNQQFYRAAFVPAPADPNLVFIEPGTFVMGSRKPKGTELLKRAPRPRSCLAEGFGLGSIP
jgi:hypothetical protein